MQTGFYYLRLNLGINLVYLVIYKRKHVEHELKALSFNKKTIGINKIDIFARYSRFLFSILEIQFLEIRY